VSPFVRKVRVALTEKGLDFEHEQVNPFTPPPGWRDVSPLGRIPAFKDGDRVINDSSVICAYLEKKFPKPALYPSDPYDYARALWIEEYMDGGVVPAFGPKVSSLVLRPLITRQPADEAAEAAARECVAKDLPPYLDYLERTLGDGEYFVGNRITIADIAVASPFVNLRHAGVAPERKRWPQLRAFLDRIWSRPYFKKPIDEETPVFGKRAERIHQGLDRRLGHRFGLQPNSRFAKRSTRVFTPARSKRTRSFWPAPEPETPRIVPGPKIGWRTRSPTSSPGGASSCA
jgi:glutathione S-transferase